MAEDKAADPAVPDTTLKGDRHNEGKPRLSMVLEAPNALAGTTAILEFGAAKYDRSNWKKGLRHTEIADSLLRHLLAWVSGEDTDPESGLPHVDHMCCNAIFLAEMTRIRPDLDDRSTKNGTTDTGK